KPLSHAPSCVASKARRRTRAAVSSRLPTSAGDGSPALSFQSPLRPTSSVAASNSLKLSPGLRRSAADAFGDAAVSCAIVPTRTHVQRNQPHSEPASLSLCKNICSTTCPSSENRDEDRLPHTERALFRTGLGPQQLFH